MRASVAKKSGRIARARGHYYGHGAGSDDRYYWRLGHHDDCPGPTDHDQTGLQKFTFLWLYRGFRNSGHPHSAQHHADYHGRPDGCVGRQHVHGRNRPRTGPCLFLPGLCGGLRQTQAGGRPTVATGITPCAKE